MWNLRHALSVTGALVVLAAVLAARAETAPPPMLPEPPEEGLLRNAARQLQEQPTLRVNLRQRSDFFGYAVTGSGSYLQKSSPRGLLLKMEWRLAIGQRMTTLQQVSDGRFLWLRRNDVPGDARLGRVDLARVEAAWEDRPAAAGAFFRTPPLAFGGLPRMLLELNQHFHFPDPRSGSMGGVPVWVLRGTWKQESLEELWPESVPADANRGAAATLPPHVPTHVQIVLEQADRMPRRIEYLRAVATDPSRPAEDASRQFRRLMTLEMLEIVRGEPLDDTLFFYEPGQQEIIDQTEHYLQNRTSRH